MSSCIVGGRVKIFKMEQAQLTGKILPIKKQQGRDPRDDLEVPDYSGVWWRGKGGKMSLTSRKQFKWQLRKKITKLSFVGSSSSRKGAQ